MTMTPFRGVLELSGGLSRDQFYFFLQILEASKLGLSVNGCYAGDIIEHYLRAVAQYAQVKMFVKFASEVFF